MEKLIIKPVVNFAIACVSISVLLFTVTAVISQVESMKTLASIRHTMAQLDQLDDSLQNFRSSDQELDAMIKELRKAGCNN